MLSYPNESVLIDSLTSDWWGHDGQDKHGRCEVLLPVSWQDVLSSMGGTWRYHSSPSLSKFFISDFSRRFHFIQYISLMYSHIRSHFQTKQFCVDERGKSTWLMLWCLWGKILRLFARENLQNNNKCNLKLKFWSTDTLTPPSTSPLSPAEEARGDKPALCGHVELRRVALGARHQRGAVRWPLKHGDRHEGEMDSIICTRLWQARAKPNTLIPILSTRWH